MAKNILVIRKSVKNNMLTILKVIKPSPNKIGMMDIDKNIEKTQMPVEKYLLKYRFHLQVKINLVLILLLA